MGVSNPAVQASSAAVASDPNYIASALKRARLGKGLSQRELANRAGVSAGLIGQIETCRTRPSVKTLVSIAEALGLALDVLFIQSDINEVAGESAMVSAPNNPLCAQPRSLLRNLEKNRAGRAGPPREKSQTGYSETHVVRHGCGTSIQLQGGVTWELLTPEVDHDVSFMLVTYPPGSASSADRHLLRHDDKEYFYLLEGVLEVQLAFEKTTLHAGDAMSFDSSRPHRFENRADVRAIGVWSVVRKDRAHDVGTRSKSN